MILCRKASSLLGLSLLIAVFSFAHVSFGDDELINVVEPNGSFEQDYVGWWHGISDGAEAIMSIDDKDAIDGDKCAYIEVVTVTGTNWHVGIGHSELTLFEGEKYTADFYAKADVPRVISMEIKVSPPDPYENITETNVNINEEWAEFSQSFVPARDYSAIAQIDFWLGQVVGEVWIDGVRVYEGDKQDREDDSPQISVAAKGKLTTTWASIKSPD